MEIQLNKADWLEVKKTAEEQVKQSSKAKQINQAIYELAEMELKKLKV